MWNLPRPGIELLFPALAGRFLSTASLPSGKSHTSILASEIPWTGEPGGLQSMGSPRVGHDLATKHRTTTYGAGEE